MAENKTAQLLWSHSVAFAGNKFAFARFDKISFLKFRNCSLESTFNLLDNVWFPENVFSQSTSNISIMFFVVESIEIAIFATVQ